LEILPSGLAVSLALAFVVVLAVLIGAVLWALFGRDK